MPLNLLHIDASARPGISGTDPHGSHTRRLSARFVEHWRKTRPDDRIDHLDAESDRLVDQLVAADLIVVGLPMYNFSVPAQFKAYIDNIVRVGRTFGFDRARGAVPYWPMLAGAGKRMVLLGARGDHGYDPGGRIAHLNHAEASVRSVFGYIGITDVHEAAVECDEFGGEQLAQSMHKAEAAVDRLVDELSGTKEQARERAASTHPASRTATA
jgi:FMN-dependent NADH-azoreductase